MVDDFIVNESRIDSLIEGEQARFLAARPKSAALWEQGKKHFLYGGPSHWMRRWAGGFPVYVDQAKGSQVIDVDGLEYSDFCLGDTGGMCGHAPEAVRKAANEQLSRGATTMLPTEDSIWVGEELHRRFKLPYWTLTTSATDANRAAIRIARMITGREKVLVFSGCYHGGVEEAHVQLIDGKMALRNAIHPNGVDHSKVSKVVEFNDVEALEAALAQEDVACVLAEPVMTNYGIIPVADGFHEALRTLTRKHGTVLIIDETHTISSGPGGCTMEMGLEPDIFVVGKAIGGGIPCGVFGCSEEIARKMWAEVPYANPKVRQSAHMGMGGTLAGNALTIATMKAVLSEILTPANYEHMIARAGELAAGAEKVINDNGLPWHVTQIGSRAEIMFGAHPPRNGAEAGRMRAGGLETLLHAFYLKEGILVTPFHTMFLMCPETRALDVERHDKAFAKFVDMLKSSGALEG